MDVLLENLFVTGAENKRPGLGVKGFFDRVGSPYPPV